MISVERRERIRRAYYVDGKSMRQIAGELRHSYWTVRDALESAASQGIALAEAMTYSPGKEAAERGRPA